MSDNYTPGPWELGRPRSLRDYPRMCYFDAEVEIYPPDASQTGGHQHAGPIALVSVGEDGGANARLIAAAPDLLAACQAALPLLHSLVSPDQYGGEAGRVLMQLWDAIEKARLAEEEE